MTNVHFKLLREYDIAQNVIEIFSNVSSRSILFCIRDEAKDAARIAAELQLSLSAVYTILRRLEILALVEKRYHLDNKKKLKMYRSRISRVEISMDGGEPEIKLFSSSHPVP